MPKTTENARIDMPEYCRDFVQSSRALNGGRAFVSTLTPAPFGLYVSIILSKILD